MFKAVVLNFFDIASDRRDRKLGYFFLGPLVNKIYLLSCDIFGCAARTFFHDLF